MTEKHRIRSVPGVAFVNLQKRYVVRTASLLALVRNLKRRLRLEKREFNICFVDDNAIRHLNLAYRGKDKPTDVLSFPWNDGGGGHLAETPASSHGSGREGHAHFLGDVVISVEMARRNARMEGHSTLNEIRWLILHGVLHLLGYDHEHDTGQMIALELALRDKLELAGSPRPGRKSKDENRISKFEIR